ncbi:MAG TPA: LON peptidase substrate-binding domain-containing protein [Hyphomonadaceae bacterium]|nr:LON peptidase substrate-binding domain-containing protein [Hyphomonadaceae bacterium]
MPRGYRKPADLPVAIPVFPLGGALLFPKAVLPLNIFEPRYLSMVDAALVGHRIIGMIQPAGIVTPVAHGQTDNPDLSEVGCAGRITGFQETDDGRYLIALTGITRFRVTEEIRQNTPYRIVRADWDAFAEDLNPKKPLDDTVRQQLVTALHSYLERSGMKADWGAVEEAPVDTLVNSLSAGCPFSNPEKQALLEARTLEERCSALITLLMMERPGTSGGYVQ